MLQKRKLSINIARLKTDIEELGEFGKNNKGGLDRTTFISSELAAREWLKSRLEHSNLVVKVDEAANIWGKRKGARNLPSIVFGSHIDTVPNGGKYDGALGVLMALEVLRVLEENGIVTRHPLEFVSFSAEEPNPFGLSTFGSRAVSGKLTKVNLIDVADTAGTKLTDALRSAGGSFEQFANCIRKPIELSAYLEVHIEQGKRLVNSSIPIGIVMAITGIYREQITVFGEANHAGTTLMEDRKDALAAASELILSLERACLRHPSKEVVGTIGKITASPNAPNIIPDKVTMTLEVRGKTSLEIQEVLAAFTLDCLDCKEKRAVQIERKVLLDQAPAEMDEVVMEAIKSSAELLNFPYLILGSMAGHDAAHMAAITRSGMIFVPSVGGKSHCPEEESRLEDIEKAANVLLHSILSLDEKLDV
ncbi:Zn-dependent hydrolase [Niallia taxi]|uniref:Zn-dependent hydrolase n=1 Tax=Niallia taxi TaxID=2499688 RepID=UPI002E251543|nr:Zn-dependent hydrolase [Niallia taxi]MED4122010.1 Zn-dependent hydrolase [Niallia taxi]